MPVDFDLWKQNFAENWDESPKRATMQALWCTYLAGWLTVTSRPQFEVGTNVYERNWDVLVLLDACRADALRAVAPEYDFLDSAAIETTWSVGSGTLEFLCKTFTTDYRSEINDTAYLSANGYVNRVFHYGSYAPSVGVPFGSPRWNVVDAEEFGRLQNVAKTRSNPDIGTDWAVPPGELTDAAIAAGRALDHDRFIFHYNQPHTPHLAAAVKEGRRMTSVEQDPFTNARQGSLDEDTLRHQYLDNLRFALDSVEVLLENIDADRVAITADHGESLGEWHVYGHPTGYPHPVVKRVPWTITTATDTGSYEPEALGAEEEAEMSEREVNENLEALGYV